MFPEVDVFLRFLLLHVLERIQDFLAQPLPDLSNVTIFLKPLPGYVQRQVGGIHDAPDESQVRRQEFLAMLHDQDAPDVKMQAEFPRGVKKIEWSFGWNEQKGLILRAALGTKRPGNHRF